MAKLPAFVTLLGTNKLNTVVLLDSSTTDIAPIERFREAGRLGAGGLVQIGDVLDQPDADVEDDLVDPGFFVELFNDAYQGLLAGRKLTVKELPADNRLIRRVENALGTHLMGPASCVPTNSGLRRKSTRLCSGLSEPGDRSRDQLLERTRVHRRRGSELTIAEHGAQQSALAG